MNRKGKHFIQLMLGLLLSMLLSGCAKDSFTVAVEADAIDAGQQLVLTLNYFRSIPLRPVLVTMTDSISSMGLPYFESFNNSDQLTIYPVRSGDIEITVEFYPRCNYSEDLPPELWQCFGSTVTKTTMLHVTINPDVLLANLPVEDPGLQACIEESGALTTAELTVLDCSDRNISNLSGIQYLYSLNELNLAGNHLNRYGLRPLDYLEQLTEVLY